MAMATYEERTLVTGASGFIGSAVVRALLGRGRRVRCYVEPGAALDNLAGLDVELVEGDINDRQRVSSALAGCTSLHHLAGLYALWQPDPGRLYEVNVEGAKTVLWAAYHHRPALRRIVFTSSIAAVGRPGDGTPADERCPFNHWTRSNGYIRSKWLGEAEALRFAEQGLPVVVVNPAFPFGERDLGPTPTGRLIAHCLREGRVWGYLDGGFCVVDVEDVAQAHVLAEERGRVGERYILGNHNVTYRDFYRTVARVAGLPFVDVRIPSWFAVGLGAVAEQVAQRTGRPPMTTYGTMRYATEPLYFRTSKARLELGMPKTPLGVTIEKAVRWFRRGRS
jgi:dihydroflavonol-4-reductase